ncbi:MAG TPA: flagellar brake protein [Paraburkholderia sp.]|jgi:c-di-GMP-binding flagellar brake protein YcgR|nr:flagellar brake protein [Paraburkholderia sp.]
MQTTEDIAGPAANPPPVSLNEQTVPVGTPLEWPIVDADGTLLFERGAVVLGPDELRFLFAQFQPRRGDVTDEPTASAAAPSDADQDTPLTLPETHLAIGALIGMRPQTVSNGPMYPSRIIGFAPNQSLFAMPPLSGGRHLPLTIGENVEIVAIASQAVFRFVCTVDSVCQLPFDYVVLSRPGVIRRLRERKSIRVRARLPVRFGLDPQGTAYEGLGLMQTVSAFGMSFATPWVVGEVGRRLRVSFRLRSKDVDTMVETTAIIRNAHPATEDGGLATHGIEFEQLDAAQQLALKSFVFDRIDDVSYWSNGTR